MSKPVVLIPDPIASAGMNLLRSACDCIAPWAYPQSPGTADVRNRLSETDAVIVRLFPVRADDLAAAPRLKVIAKHGVGVDTIDVAAATARKIPVVFTPMANANGVAEHTLALMLALARHIVPANAALLAGRFQERARFEGLELADKTLGVIGLGRIGRRVAEMAANGFAMNVRAYDPFIKPADVPSSVKLVASLEDVLKTADFLTLHMPLTPETRHLLNEARLKLLKPTCRVINTSRGAVIDEAALAAALREDRIAGAALDVFEEEPLPADHVFLRTPNTLLTPHISSATKESLDRMAVDAAQGVLDVLQGRRPAYPVNPEIWQ